MKDLDASPGFDPVSALPSLREALTLAFRSWKTIDLVGKGLLRADAPVQQSRQRPGCVEVPQGDRVSRCKEVALANERDCRRQGKDDGATPRARAPAVTAAVASPAASASHQAMTARKIQEVAERTNMRYQWIKRFLKNDLVDSDAVMEPFAPEVLERAAADSWMSRPSGVRLRKSLTS